ncbi:hypothetical protein TNCV_1910171 [Trichonephila clavipes]|nr:hypothetical protein TNCV_1910171 [Trichonephila clavipes]
MPKEVEELVFVWASRLSPYPWVRFDYPFPFVIRSKIGENYSVCSSSQAFLIFLRLIDWWTGWRPRMSEVRFTCQHHSTTGGEPSSLPPGLPPFSSHSDKYRFFFVLPMEPPNIECKPASVHALCRTGIECDKEFHSGCHCCDNAGTVSSCGG